MVIWLIGLSGSGKSTLGREIAQQLRYAEPNTVLLDGDQLRKIFAHDQGDEPYSPQGRRLNAERTVALCEMLDGQGMNVVCCMLLIFEDIRIANRHRFSRYFEIFMDAPIDVLKRRDIKGLYGSSRRGEVKYLVGMDIKFERPIGSDITIDSSNDCPDIPALASMVLRKVQCK